MRTPLVIELDHFKSFTGTLDEFFDHYPDVLFVAVLTGGKFPKLDEVESTGIAWTTLEAVRQIMERYVLRAYNDDPEGFLSTVKVFRVGAVRDCESLESPVGENGLPLATDELFDRVDPLFEFYLTRTLVDQWTRFVL